MTPEALVSLLRFADGLFPAGGYAHSLGLETYVQRGAIVDAAGAETYLCAYLEASAGPCDAVAAVGALKAARRNDLAALLHFDRALDAMKPAFELREASRQMGRQAMRVAAATVGAPIVKQFEQAVAEAHAPCHHAIVFGLVGGVCGWTPENAATAYLYATAAQLIGAEMRLLPIGQIEGQQILARIAERITHLARDASERGFEEIWSFAPGIEIAAMRHAALDARLFRS
ncbi:MAG TPA: urease accessory UreF family protein [Candidatus Binataceae bacterium]|nr:urease accessory UreF family protein [Candidatus Binataceae bacterium]